MSGAGRTLFISEQNRTDLYGFLQDEWRFAPDWTPTAGVRVDHYSISAPPSTPTVAGLERVAHLTAKLLYGRAFRAPSFTELYSNNAALLGNPDLKPETINTVELGLTQRWNLGYGPGSTSSCTNWTSTFAASATRIHRRNPAGWSTPLESEVMAWNSKPATNSTPALNLAANYAFQTAEDQGVRRQSRTGTRTAGIRRTQLADHARLVAEHLPEMGRRAGAAAR